MPYIRSEEDGYENDDDDDGLVTYTGDFKYFEPAEVAYKPKPFDPAALPAVAAAAWATLKAIGVTCFRIRYDGGHDEGFAHAESARLADGRSLSLDALAEALATPQQAAAFRAAAAGPKASHWYKAGEHYAGLGDGAVVKAALDEIAGNLADCLFGEGFGTGEYSMYGAFVIDMATGAMVDDRDVPRPPESTFE